MIRRIVVLLVLGCLWLDLAVSQQVQIPVTHQAPPVSTTTQTPGPSPVGLEDRLLENLVREALQKNPAVQSALHMVEAQRRRVPQAKTLPDPTASVSWMGNIRPFSVQTGDPSSYSGVEAMQMLPYPGKLKLRGEIASKEDDPGSSDLEAIRRRVTADVRTGRA